MIGEKAKTVRAMVPALVAAVAFTLGGCKVEKQADDTYKVAPQPATQTAAEKARQETKEAGTELKQGAQDLAAKVKTAAQDASKTEAADRVRAGAREAGQGIKQGAGEAAQAAGQALQRAGQKIENEAKGTKPVVTTTVKTDTGTKTTTYH